MEISVGFVQEERTQRQICSVTALNKKWFMTTATCLKNVIAGVREQRNKTYAVYFADADDNNNSLTRILIGKMIYWGSNNRSPRDFKNIDVAIFQVRITL